MPRQARKKSESGIYHVMLRGINRQTIFEDEEDCNVFLETIAIYKDEMSTCIYGYCLIRCQGDGGLTTLKRYDKMLLR